MELLDRIAVITALVKQVQEKRGAPVPRTVLMKMLYLLQEVMQVPLGYQFRFYNYGPYDARVLNDIAVAQAWNALIENCVEEASFYSYEIQVGSGADAFMSQHQAIIDKYCEPIQTVASHFAQYGAAEMEIVATLVWIDQIWYRQNHRGSIDELQREFALMKHRLAERDISQFIQILLKIGALRAVSHCPLDAQVGAK